MWSLFKYFDQSNNLRTEGNNEKTRAELNRRGNNKNDF